MTLKCDAVCVEIDRLAEQIAAGKDPRARIKQARRIGFLARELGAAAAVNASAWLDGAVTPARLEAMVEKARAAFWLAASKGGDPDFCTLTMLAIARGALSGRKEATVLAEVSAVTRVETACLVATASPAFDPRVVFEDDSRHAGVLEAMNRGDFYMLSLGGDGEYEVTLRIVDAPDPVITGDELARVIRATAPGFLSVEGPVLVCGPLEDITRGALLGLPQGLLKIQAFALAPQEDGMLEDREIDGEAQAEEEDGEAIAGFGLLFVACFAQTPPEPLARPPEIRLFPI